MFVYEKKLQYPVRIKNTNPKLASIIISQYGGPNGELGAALRYLSQRYSMPFDEQRGLLTDIGTEELGHLEMVGTIVHQLTRNLTEEQQQESSFAPYFVDHTAGVYPQAASGTPWSAATMQVMGCLLYTSIGTAEAEAPHPSRLSAQPHGRAAPGVHAADSCRAGGRGHPCGAQKRL